MSKHNPTDSYSRFLDLQKQGFMRMVNNLPKPKKIKTPLVMVACNACKDWHYKNKHTISKEEREINNLAYEG